MVSSLFSFETTKSGVPSTDPFRQQETDLSDDGRKRSPKPRQGRSLGLGAPARRFLAPEGPVPAAESGIHTTRRSAPLKLLAASI